MKNKASILTNLTGEATPVSISNLNVVALLPSTVLLPNDSYGGFIPIHYSMDNDIHFSAIKFFLNEELVHTSNKPVDTFNINVTTEFNKLNGYSVNRFGLKLPQTEFEVLFTTVLDQTKPLVETSRIIKYNLPNFIQDEYPTFVNFIEAYYQFLEKSNNPNLIHYNLENYKDIDTVPNYILDYFRNELMPGFNLNLTKDRQTGGLLNERSLMKNIKQFYDSKGTENSIKFLFRLLFDKEATIFYPREYLLRPSDAIWTVDKTIDIYVVSPSLSRDLTNLKIYQRDINDEIQSHGIIKNTFVSTINGGYRARLFLHEVSGLFANTNPVYILKNLDGVDVETEVNVIKNGNNILSLPPLNSDGTRGRFDTLGGALSEQNRLIPDNIYWQTHSYDVKGNANPLTSINIIKKLAHPAGFKIFSTYTPLSISELSFENNNTPETQTELVIGNYLPYTTETVQDLNYIQTSSTDNSTDEIMTFRMFPDGILFGETGLDITPEVKTYITPLLNGAKTVNLAIAAGILTEEITRRSPAGSITTISNLTTKNRIGTKLINFGQIHPDDINQEYWGVGIHPRDLINMSTDSSYGTDKPYNENTPFGALRISDLINIKVNTIIK